MARSCYKLRNWWTYILYRKHVALYTRLSVLKPLCVCFICLGGLVTLPQSPVESGSIWQGQRWWCQRRLSENWEEKQKFSLTFNLSHTRSLLLFLQKTINMLFSLFLTLLFLCLTLLFSSCFLWYSPPSPSVMVWHFSALHSSCASDWVSVQTSECVCEY